MKLFTSPTFKTLKNWFTPPVFDDQDKTLKAHSSFSLAIVGFTTSVFTFTFFLLFSRENTFRLLMIGSSVLLSLLPIVFLRKGYVRGTIFFQAGLIWVGVVSTAITTGGVHSIGFIGGTIAALLVMGIALELVNTFIFIFVSILAAGILAWAESYGYIKHVVDDNPVILVATYASFLFVLAGLLYVTYRNVTQALAKANQELIERQHAEAQYRTLFESSPEGIIIFDTQGHILLANPSACAALGYTAAELAEKEPKSFIAPHDFEQNPIPQERLRAGETIHRERILRKKDGLDFTVISSTRQMEDGRFQYIFRDISERKQAELEIRQRAEQLATIVEIGHAVSTLQNLESVLEIIYQQIQRIAPVDAFFICLYDEAHNRLSFPLTYDLGVRYDQSDSYLGLDQPLAYVIKGGQPYRLHRTPERMAELAEEAGDVGNAQLRSKSILFVPLWQAQRVIGALSIQTYSYNSYSDEIVETVAGIGDQAAIAIQNSRLFTSVQQELADRKQAELQARQHAEQLATIVEISHAVSTLQNLESVLEIIYQQIQRIASVDAFFICLLGEDRKQLLFPLTYDMGVRYNEPDGQLRPESRLGQVVQTGQPLCIHRTAQEVAEAEKNGRGVGNAKRKSGSLLFVPLWQAHEVIGVLSIQSYSLNAYPDELVETLAGIGDQAALAIQNSRLFTSVQQELGERKRAEAQVRELNADLERRVRERTAQLESANKELESFSYSVSHDLRTPLRAINGFSKILNEDFSAEFSPMARNFLQKIVNAGEKMAVLIDNLLDFSRLGRKPLKLETLDPAEIVHATIETLAPETAGRQIKWILTETGAVTADSVLLQQVYANLIGNAIKYTSKRSEARIEIGSFDQNGETVYFVRDNGAGFDMQYADRLFGVFQRLHREEEFEGTGIGLATVQRIIERHGGRIWAEAEPDKGATFYFTLG